MTTKTINWKKNYNNKIDCDVFVHLDAAPSDLIPEKVLNETIFVINIMDKSHPPVQVKLDDLARFPLSDLKELCTIVSHGMTKQEYLESVKDLNWTPDTPMALYYYKKVKDAA